MDIKTINLASKNKRYFVTNFVTDPFTIKVLSKLNCWLENVNSVLVNIHSIIITGFSGATLSND